ncbi:unnamed protein product [Ectocarpus sp. CCAP 1310/34]|nr:unnamed protein product [Ectocarpus sp. CCAP 1310/34]
MQEVLGPEQQAFGAEVDASGSSQPLPDPQLSITSPIGQKSSDVEAVPMTYKDVICSKYKVFWEAAMEEEIDGHDKTGTFTKVKELPEGRKAIGSKWVFSWKTNEKGLIVDFKARMVARGFSQIPGIDFHHSSSACPSAAFPEGCGSMSGKVVKVERALYGLKQSGREWGFEAAYALIENGYEQCRVDPCVFRKVVDGEVIALVRIVSCLNFTKDFGITYERGSGLDLSVFVDASYANNEVDRRSTTGLAVTVGGTVVCASTKTQPVTAQSTSEAEYMAAGEGVKEALFVRGVLSFIAPETSGAKIKVLEDNKGALALIENPFSSARSEHIDVRFHFICELFKSGKIAAEYVPTGEQHADMLTKVFGREKLKYHQKALMNLPM